METLTPKIRQALRRYVGYGENTNPKIVVLENSYEPPKAKGNGYYWTTPSGKTRVRYPNAYKWPTWYHASTKRVEVGDGWLVAYGII